MSPSTDMVLAVQLSRLATARAESPVNDDAPTADQLLVAVASFQDLVRVSTDLQRQAVRAAHQAGVSWGSIGKLLGTSRQAVQQRFDPHYVPADPPGGASRILGPVTRAEEMHHLAAAGNQGWRLVRALHGEHVLERDDQDWEVKRVSVASARQMPSGEDGWRAAATRFPDCFYIRPVKNASPGD